MKQYSRVSYAVRCQIYAYLQAEISIPEIAHRLGFHKSTIYRELRRNVSIGYRPEAAHNKAQLRYQNCRKPHIVNAENERLIRQGLREQLSPEQISGRLKMEYGQSPSHQTIYNFVNKKRDLYVLLRRFNKRGAGRYRQRSRLKSRGLLSVHLRSKIERERGRIGDWERDTMHAMNGRHLLICTDRKSRFTKVGLIQDHNNRSVNNLTKRLVSSTKKKMYTMTNDNGREFKANLNWGTKTYFCDPYKPQQRGTVENTIGLLRQYVARKTDISNWKKREINELEKRINLRPRKVLGYKTPYEVYFNKKVALACLI